MRPRPPWRCTHTDRPYQALGLCKACYLKQNGGSRRWYVRNRDKVIKKSTKWNKDHLMRHCEIGRASAKRMYARDPQKNIQAGLNRYHTNLNHRLACNLRTRVRQALRGVAKSVGTMNLLGCSIPFLRRHLEQQFIAGMSWENHGKFGWHIDHIKPCAVFDLRSLEQQHLCFHYTNLQPLWAFDNQSKGGRP